MNKEAIRRTFRDRGAQLFTVCLPLAAVMQFAGQRSAVQILLSVGILAVAALMAYGSIYRGHVWHIEDEIEVAAIEAQTADYLVRRAAIRSDNHTV